MNFNLVSLVAGIGMFVGGIGMFIEREPISWFLGGMLCIIVSVVNFEIYFRNKAKEDKEGKR